MYTRNYEPAGVKSGLSPADLYAPHAAFEHSGKHIKYSSSGSPTSSSMVGPPLGSPLTPVSHVALFNNNLPPTYSPTSLR